MKTDSYLRAQRQYDAQLPDVGARSDGCHDCDGEGHQMTTDCCDKPFEYDDFGNPICRFCGNQADRPKCDRCNGTGQIDLDAEKAARREAYLEDKADTERDESR